MWGSVKAQLTSFCAFMPAGMPSFSWFGISGLQTSRDKKDVFSETDLMLGVFIVFTPSDWLSVEDTSIAQDMF